MRRYAAAAAVFAFRRPDKLTQSAHIKFEGIIAMQKNTFVVSLTGMTKMPPLMIKLAMPFSLTSILSRRERIQTNRYASFTLMAVAALSGIVLMFPAQSADAVAFKPIFMADAGMNMNGMDMKSMKMEAAQVTHRGTGTVRKIDAVKGTVTLSHGPIASLNWSAMTMRFKLKDASLAKGIKIGDIVDFELVQSGSNYMVTRLSGK